MLRQGRRSKGIGRAFFPAYIVTDLARGPARFLPSFFYQLANDVAAAIHAWFNLYVV